MADLRKISNYTDVIVEPLYDTALYPAAGSVLLPFFTVPFGAGNTVFQTAGGAVSPKTYADTNQEGTPGALPGGYYFKLLGFRIQPSFDITDADIKTIFNGAVFTFFIASKPFLRVPARCIPQGNGPSGSGASMNSLGWPMLANSYSIAKQPLDLLPTQNFAATLTWPSGQLHPATTADAAVGGHLAGLPITLYLDGFKYRPVQ